MKAKNKRKVFGDAVDLLMDEIEERSTKRDSDDSDKEHSAIP